MFKDVFTLYGENKFKENKQTYFYPLPLMPGIAIIGRRLWRIQRGCQA